MSQQFLPCLESKLAAERKESENDALPPPPTPTTVERVFDFLEPALHKEKVLSRLEDILFSTQSSTHSSTLSSTQSSTRSKIIDAILIQFPNGVAKAREAREAREARGLSDHFSAEKLTAFDQMESESGELQFQYVAWIEPRFLSDDQNQWL